MRLIVDSAGVAEKRCTKKLRGLTPLLCLPQIFVFLRDRSPGETSTDLMIGHLLLTSFWKHMW